MNTIYDIMPEDKRNKILSASQFIFGKDGYDNASINQIIKEAGISKGLLYHYFDSKFVLYEETFICSLNMFMDMMSELLQESEPDFIKRIEVLTLLKLKIYNDIPHLLSFILSIVKEEDKEIVEFFSKHTQTLRKATMGMIYDDIDYSYFRDDIDPQIAIESILATIEHWGERYRSSQGEETPAIYKETLVIKEMKPYLEFFRQSYYKNPKEDI